MLLYLSKDWFGLGGWFAEDREEVGEACADWVFFLHVEGFRVLEIDCASGGGLDHPRAVGFGAAHSDGVEIAGDDRREGGANRGWVAFSALWGVHVFDVGDDDYI